MGGSHIGGQRRDRHASSLLVAEGRQHTSLVVSADDRLERGFRAVDRQPVGFLEGGHPTREATPVPSADVLEAPAHLSL